MMRACSFVPSVWYDPQVLNELRFATLKYNSEDSIFRELVLCAAQPLD